jgi:hypothetical protein
MFQRVYVPTALVLLCRSNTPQPKWFLDRRCYVAFKFCIRIDVGTLIWRVALGSTRYIDFELMPHGVYDGISFKSEERPTRQ